MRLDCLSLSDQAARIADAIPDLNHLFPEGEARQFATAGFEAIFRLAQILDTFATDEEMGSGLYARIEALEKQITTLQGDLKKTIRKMDSLTQLLLRLEAAGEN